MIKPNHGSSLVSSQACTPFEVGTLTIANNGTGPGNVILFGHGNITGPGGDYLDTQFNTRFATIPQTLAVAVPEPSTLLLVATGIVGLAVSRHRARGASLG